MRPSMLPLTALLAASGAAQAVPVTAAFDLTSPTVVNNGSPHTFTADTGITVQASAGYDSVPLPGGDSVYTAPTGAGVVGDQWIDLEYAQRLVLDTWSKNGRLVGFTLQEDDVRNGLGSSAQLFGGATGTDLLGTWNMNLFNFRTTVDVDSSFAVKELKWEYTQPVPVPAAVWLFGSALAGLGMIGRRKAG